MKTKVFSQSTFSTETEFLAFLDSGCSNTQHINNSSYRIPKNLETLNIGRFNDMQKLLEMRQYNISHDQRSLFLTLYGYFMLLTNNGNNYATFHKLMDISYCWFTRSVEVEIDYIESISNYSYMHFINWSHGIHVFIDKKMYRSGLNYTNTKLIEVFEITEEEQKLLETIKSKEFVSAKHNLHRRTQRRNSDGLTKRDAAKQLKICEIMELRSKGYNNSKIAEMMGVSRQIVSKYVNSSSNSGNPQSSLKTVN